MDRGPTHYDEQGSGTLLTLILILTLTHCDERHSGPPHQGVVGGVDTALHVVGRVGSSHCTVALDGLREGEGVWPRGL